jgi:uncharacterized protein with GYD domain
MATYFMFGKYSAAAFKGVSAKRTEKSIKLIQKYGGEVQSMHALLGERDLIFIVKFPGISEAIKASVAVSKLTGIGFTTSPAVPVEEFDRMMTAV